MRRLVSLRGSLRASLLSGRLEQCEADDVHRHLQQVGDEVYGAPVAEAQIYAQQAERHGEVREEQHLPHVTEGNPCRIQLESKLFFTHKENHSKKVFQ